VVADPGYFSGMAFELDPNKPIPKAVRSTAEKQLKKIVKALSSQAGLDPDEATHDARKRTKKLRALLRLVRPELGDEVYRRENRALRDAARQLSAVRDAWVLVEALDDLDVPAPELRTVLVSEYRDLQTDREEHGRLPQAAEQYELVLARVADWRLADRGWKSLADGLEKVVRDGRRHMDKACSRGGPEEFHEWRKQAKYLRHQLELVRPAWPDVLEGMASTASRIGDLLGADHDLAVLRERAQGETALGPETRESLLDRIDERRREVQQEAIALGRRLYSEKPAALTNRLGRLWNVAA
jgi:CHAD domain-containing protein